MQDGLCLSLVRGEDSRGRIAVQREKILTAVQDSGRLIFNGTPACDGRSFTMPFGLAWTKTIYYRGVMAHRSLETASSIEAALLARRRFGGGTRILEGNADVGLGSPNFASLQDDWIP